MESRPVTTNGEQAQTASGGTQVPDALPVPPISYKASIYTGPADQLSPEFASAVLALEKKLALPVWLMVQSYHSHERGARFITLDHDLFESFVTASTSLERNKPIALVIDSGGGDAKCAYEIATFLRKRCGGFTAVIPRSAKSAATLLALGSRDLIVGELGELGPLDVQIYNDERDEVESALNEFQALERLNAFALQALDQTMILMLQRTGKRIDKLLPYICEFVATMTRPLFEKIDVVHYTQTARDLKIGEDYAVRLLRDRYAEGAETIARSLVADYSDHDFRIDTDEITRLGLKLADVDPELEAILARLRSSIEHVTAIGQLKEVQSDAK